MPCTIKDFVLWAKLNGFDDVLPESFTETLNDNTSILQAESADNENKTKLRSEKDRTRKDNLKRAIDAAIERLGKKPTLDELWNYFERGDDITECVQDCSYDKITWADTKGKIHDLSRESVANRLAKIKA